MKNSATEWKPPRMKLCPSTRRRLTVTCLGAACVLGYLSLSLSAPIYPIIATNRGVDATTYGWVFGVFPLVQCCSAPVFGKLVARVGPKCLFVAGSLVAAVTGVLFGCMDMIPPSGGEDGVVTFVVMSFAIRILQALGNSAVGTAVFTLAAVYFPDNLASVMGILESACGLGLSVGPAIAGALYEVEGFLLPFALVGGVHFLLVPVSYIVLESNEENCSSHQEEPTSLISLLHVPGIVILMISQMGVAATWLSLDPLLEPHLKSKFGVSSTIVGLVFLSTSLTYTLSAPIIGWISDKLDDSVPLMILGNAILAAGMLLFGPSPLTGLLHYQSFWLNLFLNGLFGVGFCLVIVPSYNQILSLAYSHGFPDSVSTTGAISGIWSFFYSFGEFLGPTVGGWLYDNTGFAWTMTVWAGINLFMGLVQSVYWLCSQGASLKGSLSFTNRGRLGCVCCYRGQHKEVGEKTPIRVTQSKQ